MTALPPWGVFEYMMALTSLLGTGTVAGLTTWATIHDEKRDIGEASAIFAINTTNMRGRDLAKLHRLRVDLNSPETAMFSNKNFNVEGNVTGPLQSGANNKFVHGGLKFRVPGLDEDTEGSFVVINHDTADDKTKKDFEKVHALLQEEHPQSSSRLEDMIASVAQAL